LKEEYLKVLSNWEHTNDEVRKLNAERRLLRKKVELLMAAPQKNLLNGTSNMDRVTDEDLTSLIIA